jgi:hypothetical protein
MPHAAVIRFDPVAAANRPWNCGGWPQGFTWRRVTRTACSCAGVRAINRAINNVRRSVDWRPERAFVRPLPLGAAAVRGWKLEDLGGGGRDVAAVLP